MNEDKKKNLLGGEDRIGSKNKQISTILMIVGFINEKYFNDRRSFSETQT